MEEGRNARKALFVFAIPDFFLALARKETFNTGLRGTPRL